MVKLDSFLVINLTGIMVLSVLSVFSSCATKTKFITSSESPAVQGFIKVSKGNDQNYIIQIHISDLPVIEKSQNSNQSYVVWMETNKGTNKNLGQLKSSSNSLSKPFKGSLSMASPYKPAKIFITTENSMYVQEPGKALMISTGKF